MKMWRKLFSFWTIIALVAMVGCDVQEEKRCCLCNSTVHTTLCMVDLETGDMLELDMPSVSDAYGGESNVETFSIIRFGEVVGTKQTAPDVIELCVPALECVKNMALCGQCRKLLSEDYCSRYILADLRNPGSPKVILVENDVDLTVYGYQIAMEQDVTNGTIDITIRMAPDGKT